MTTLQYADLYDAIYAEKNYAGEVDCVLGLIGKRVETLLDIGCGTGRHARVFSERGIHVTGVDIDPTMIQVARATAGGRYPSLTFVHGSADEAPEGPFDAVVSLFNVVNYVPHLSDLSRVFRAAAARLGPSGSLIFDAWNGLAALRDPPVTKETSVLWCGQQLKVRTSPALDEWNQVVRLDVDIRLASHTGDEEHVTHTFSHRLWTPRELRDVLEGAGLRLQRVVTWATPDRPAQARDWKLLFHAIRP